MIDRLKTVFALVGCCCIVNLTFPLCFIITGIVQIDECPSDSIIPIWMIALGAFLLVSKVLNVAFTLSWPEDEHGLPTTPSPIRVLIIFLYIIEMCFYAFGLYRTLKLFFLENNTCSGFVFWPTFILSVIAFLDVFLSILCTVCVCCGLLASETYQFTRLKMRP